LAYAGIEEAAGVPACLQVPACNQPIIPRVLLHAPNSEKYGKAGPWVVCVDWQMDDIISSSPTILALDTKPELLHGQYYVPWQAAEAFSYE
jgi:hypothetical protein